MARWCASSVILASLILAGCEQGAAKEPAPTPIRLRMNASTLARVEQALHDLPDVIVEGSTNDGPTTALEALQRNRADIGVIMADAAYQAYIEEPQGTTGQIRGIAVLNVNTIYLAAGRHTHIDSIDDIRGKRVALGTPGSAAAIIAELVLKASGIGLHNVHVERVPYTEALKGLADRRLDAAFLAFNPSVQAAAEGGARLVPIQGPWIEPLRQEYPFLQSTLVPRGTYPGQDKPLPTVGVDLLLACRADLDHDLVYRLIKAYFEGLQRSAPATDLERAPATPIPLHPGAARYYRERVLSR